MSRFTRARSRRARRICNLGSLAIYGGGALTAAVVWLGTSQVAAILHKAFPAAQSFNNSQQTGNVDLFTAVDNLLGPALWIVVGIAPLAMAWGAGAMMFGGKHGPQIMGAAIVAVVLVAAAKGIAA